MNTLPLYYAAYLGLGLTVIAWAAVILRKHGRAALTLAYRGQAEVAAATLPFLVAGFCLLNVGIMLLLLGMDAPATDVGLLVFLVRQTGYNFLIVAVNLYLNLRYINRVHWDQQYAPLPPRITR